MNLLVRLCGRGKTLASVAAVILMAAMALPAGAAPSIQQPVPSLAVGPVSTIAIDDVGGGWGWTGAAGAGDNGHLIRLQDGSWHDVPRSDPAWGALKDASAIYKIVLAGNGKSGWAIGAGGGQKIWQLNNGVWQLAPSPFENGVTLIDLAANSDATDGWITAQDQSLRYVVARLQNGKWGRALQPVNADIRFISLGPSGKTGWGIGPSRADSSKYLAVRLDNGQWVNDPKQSYEVPFNSIAVTADDNAGGWAIGPPVSSVLVRLTKGGAKQVLPDPRQEKPSLYPQLELQAIAVNGTGRGWATATNKPGPTANVPNNQPLLFSLDGDSFTPVTPTIVPSKQQTSATYFSGPIAYSPDGAHSWIAVSSGGDTFVGISELREPWEHNNPVAAAPLPGAGVCFQEVKYCLRGVFATYWHEHGGLYNMGFPITPEVEENINGTNYVVQYTQRARMEYHPEFQGTPYVVLLGLLGDILADPRLNETPFRPTPAHLNPGGQSEWFQPTQHNLQQPFYAYWNSNGGLPIFGYPRSEAFNEQNQADNNTYLVQYFERNRIEYHPENKGTQYEFLLGLLGTELFKAKYGYTP